MFNKNINSFFLTVKDIKALKSINKFEEIKKKNIDYSKIIVKKPWGYEYLFFANKSIAITILFIKKNESTSLHCHPNKTTSLYVLDGIIKFKTLTKEIILKAGQSTFVDKVVFHKSTSIEEGTYLMEIETPVNKQDLIRLEDSYGREGKGYEKEDSYSFNINNYNYISFNSSSSEHNRKKVFGKSSLSLRSINKLNYDKNIQEIRLNDLIIILNNANQIKKNFLNYQAGKFITKKEFLLILKKLIDKNVEYFLVKNIDSKIKLTDYVTKYLEKNDHNLVFLSPGDENLHLLDSIGRNEKINFISSYNEKSVCIAAEAYSVVSKKTGVVIVSSGASSIEIFNSIANSWIESSNIIYISGQAVLSEDKFLRQSGNKSFNLVNSVKDITKYAVTINNPNEIKFHLEKAFYQSRYGRFGPSLIEIPIDLQGSIINEINLKSFTFKNDFFKVSYKKKELLKIQTTLKLLKKSLRPVIIIGKGIKLSNAENELKNFISQVKIPILTSKNGADLIEDSHKLYFGRPGAYGQRSANFIIQNSDLILSIGCRLTPTFIGRANNFFARGAKKIVVDIDSNELAKKSIKINLKIHLDAKIFLLAIGKKISSLNLNFDNWMKQCKKYKLLFIDNKYNVPTIKKLKLNNNNIYPLYLFDTISRYFKNDDIIVVDNNGPLMQFLLAFKFKKNQKLISSSSLEPKGFSIAASIGASFFKKHNFIYCISEVNGFQKSLQDLQTIKDYNLPIKIILLIKDDNSVIKSTQKIFFGDRYVGTDKNSKYDVASLLKISKSNGFDIFKMYKNHSVKEKLDEFFLNKKSSILAIKVKHDQDLISKQGFIVGSDNKLIPRPLEDMQPYVSRSFLKKHMLIDIVDK